MRSDASLRSRLQTLWERHDDELRDPHAVAVQWAAAPADPDVLKVRVRGAFWDVLEELGQTLVVTREYEHLAVALSAQAGRRRLSYLRLPHPSGIAVDAAGRRLFVASTRNPNVIFELAPATGFLRRRGVPAPRGFASVLLPVACRYVPGALYLHDLAFVGGRLCANAVAMNAIVELPEGGGYRVRWWPKSIDAKAGPLLDRNYLQLNSIAAGSTLAESYFSASVEAPGRRRPGHLNFAVDRRGVVFSGRTREVVARGLTRPHSARLHRGLLYVDNSGYGEMGLIAAGRFDPIVRLRGWTRGLCLAGSLALVGTSRVIPKFRHYAPGLDTERSETGVHLVDLGSGRVLGSLLWPYGNQIFAVELLRGIPTTGFPFETGRSEERARGAFFLGLTGPDRKR